MENAGRGAAEAIEDSLAPDPVSEATVAVVCGPGNNGGDGFVVARRLALHGADVRCFLTGAGDRLRGDARANYDAWVGLGGEVVELPGDADLGPLEEALSECDLVVDALFGTGLDRAIEGRMRWVIRLINGADAYRVALDIPSGIDANTGAVLGIAVEADQTVTFAHLKQGLVTPTGADHSGDVTVVDIGVPGDLVTSTGHAAELLEAGDVLADLEPRDLRAHKGASGRVLAIAGSAGTLGAAMLVGRGALRAGAGLVWLCSFRDAVSALHQRVLEEMTVEIDPEHVERSLDLALDDKDVVVIGPGLGTDARAREVVRHVVMGWDGVKVVDADALTLVAEATGDLKSAAGRCILTPHPGEMGRLLGIDTAEVQADRFGAVSRAVEETGQVVLLKGAFTLVASRGAPVIVNPTGNPALATAGAGDVLAGVIGALACTLEPRRAAAAGAYLHGLSADRWRDSVGADRGLLAHEVADGIPAALAALADVADGGSELPD